jgi:acyl transferase domain-containing protein
MALAGGVNVISGIQNFLDLGKAGFLSHTGQCKPFDALADGYCRADGAGLVVLKPLRQAAADGDQVLGVIRGIATNQGGLSPSITVPHERAQVDLFTDVLKRSRMSKEQVSYVEAHGTGTQVGDPIEIASVRQVLGGLNRPTLHIGSGEPSLFALAFRTQLTRTNSISQGKCGPQRIRRWRRESYESLGHAAAF